jgi:predicted TIM-barrel fold metal-dependent hydrolase
MNDMSALAAAPSSLQGIKIIDADTHLSEWDDLWTARAPARYRDRVPQRKMHDGKLCWVIDGDKFLFYGAPCSSIRKDGSKSNDFEFLDWRMEDVHAGAYDGKARLEYMNANGIWAQIVYPNVLGFSGHKAASVDPELRLISVRIFNDAMAEMQSASGDRIFPMALLPWWDVKESVAEAKRCHAMGLRGVNISSDPQVHGLPDLGDVHWNPLWETCIAHDLPVNFHVGASDDSASWTGAGCWPSHGSGGQLAYGSAMLFISNMRVIANIILSRFLERFPELKIVSVESGVGWLPFALEVLEYEMNECEIKYTVPPRELFRRQIYACTWFERRHLVENARILGVDNVMFETDYPHPTCLYPGALEYVAEAAAQFTREERAKIFSGNAARVYNIPL